MQRTNPYSEHVDVGSTGGDYDDHADENDEDDDDDKQLGKLRKKI